jgi:AraC family transcriptional activator FtrA
MTKPAGQPPLVCVLAYDGLCTFEFGICVEVFGLSRPELQVPWYRFAVVAAEAGPLRAIGGVTVSASHGLELLEEASLIMVPGWRGAGEPVPAALIDALIRARNRGARVASICSGVFVLAAAGLMSGRRATTHWRYVDRLRECDPTIDVVPDVLYIDEGGVLTSAGSAAGLDLCLHIVRRDYGAEIANSVARRLVLPAHRDGGQAQFVPRPVPRRNRGEIGPVLDSIRGRLDETWSVQAMARLAGLSSRTFLRRFRDTTGESPGAWLTGQRVAFARDLLETTRLGVKSVAEQSGFGSPESLRHHFRDRIGISPTAYRASFGIDS